MALSIRKNEDKRILSAFSHKLAHYPNGGTVSMADFSQAVLYQGTPVGADSNGVFHIIKSAKVAAVVEATATTITVNGGHNFKVGDYIFAAKAGKCYAITGIATNASDSELDDITVGTALGALSVGDVLYQGGASGSNKGDFKYSPIGMVGANYDVVALDNIVCEIVTMGQLVNSATPVVLGSVVKDALKNINVI